MWSRYTTYLNMIMFRSDAGDIGEADNHALVEVSIDLLSRHRETENDIMIILLMTDSTFITLITGQTNE